MTLTLPARSRPGVGPLGPRRAVAAVAAIAIASFVGAAAVAAAGSGWGGSPGWFGSDTPLGVSRVRPGYSHLASVAGLALVIVSWLVTGLLVRLRRVGVSGVAAVAVGAAIPLLLGPPLFSSDARTYIAIGELVDRGHDPYIEGWAAAGRSDYIGRAARGWRDTPSPYSPLALRLLQGLARLAGGDLDRGAVLLRVLAVLAVAATAVLVVRLAARAGVPPAGALWLAVANPVVLFGGISGLHLDVLVAPLVLGGAALALARRPVAAGLTLGLAAQLKVTALVVVVVVAAWAVLRDRTAVAWRRAAVTAVVSAATFVVLSFVCRLGWGWVGALGVPGRVNTSVTPVDAVADLLHRGGLLPRVGNQAISGAPKVGELLALLLAAAIGLAIVLFAPIGVVEAAGWALLVLSLLGGAVWSWYLIAPLALLAMSARRPGLAWSWAGLVLLSLITLVGVRPGGGSARSLATGWADLGYLLAYAVVAALVLVGFTRRRRDDQAAARRPVLARR